MKNLYDTPLILITDTVGDVLKESDVLVDLSELGWGDFDEGGVKWNED
jgi:hypothetical protein